MACQVENGGAIVHLHKKMMIFSKKRMMKTKTIRYKINEETKNGVRKEKMIMFDLTGNVAVVTGASAGLGRQFALALARQGADVAIQARRKEKLEGVLEPEYADGLELIMNSVDAVKAADFKIAFDPTLVRGMSYYTGTIFEIAIPEFGGSCGGGGRYDKMVGKFIGHDVPACGFSIGFERIVLLLMEQGFKIPEEYNKVAYLIEKGVKEDALCDVIAQAQEERKNGTQVLVTRMNKNKKFQKEQLKEQGYEEFKEFYKNLLK